nr:DNA replication complex GINS protein PSF2 [Tanacetum cinerariifolium]
MEVNVIRPFVTGGLEAFYKLGNPEMIQESERPEHRRPQAADREPRARSFSNFTKHGTVSKRAIPCEIFNVLVLAAMNSDSHDESATVGCF